MLNHVHTFLLFYIYQYLSVLICGFFILFFLWLLYPLLSAVSLSSSICGFFILFYLWFFYPLLSAVLFLRFSLIANS